MLLVIKKIRQLARQRARELLVQNPKNLMHMLSQIKWNIPIDDLVSQNEIANSNLRFGSRYCLGRVAQTAALIEQYFPKIKCLYGEVWDDQLRNMALRILQVNGPNESILKEVLFYEDPHAVILVDELQFDPINSQLGLEINHPKVHQFPIWEGLASAWLISKSWLENDSSAKLEIIEQAERICPGTMLVAENMAATMISQDRMGESVYYLEQIIDRRITARSLFTIWLLTGNDRYLWQLKTTYTTDMVNLLMKEVES